MSGLPWNDLGPVAIFLPLLWAVLAVLTILWIALPFAVFGTKRRLDRIIDLLENPVPPPAPAAGSGAWTAAGRIFDALRRGLLGTRSDVTEEDLRPGRVSLFVGWETRRVKLADLRVRGDVVEVELDLGELAVRAPQLRPEAALARLESETARQPGLRILSTPERSRVVLQAGPEAEGRTRDLTALLKSQILDLLPS